MFVRKKKNRTGTISVVVVDKSHGFKEVKNFGVVSTEYEADILCMRAREWIHTYAGQQVIDFGRNTAQEQELKETQRAFANIDSVFMNAPQQILNFRMRKKDLKYVKSIYPPLFQYLPTCFGRI